MRTAAFVSKCLQDLSPSQKDFLVIAVIGFVGGFISYLYAINLGIFLILSFPWNAISFSIFGAVAAILGIFIFLDPDRQNSVRRIALALACGIGWLPVINGTNLLVNDVVNRRDQAKVAHAYNDTLTAANEVRKTPAAEKTKVADKLVDATADLIRYASKAGDAEAQHKVTSGTTKSLEALRGVFVIDPSYGNEAFARLVSAAALYHDPELAKSTLSFWSGVSGNAVGDRLNSKVLSDYMTKTAEVAETVKRANNLSLSIDMRLLSVQALIKMAKSSSPEKSEIKPVVELLKSAKRDMEEIDRSVSQTDPVRSASAKSQIKELTETIAEIEKLS